MAEGVRNDPDGEYFAPFGISQLGGSGMARMANKRNRRKSTKRRKVARRTTRKHNKHRRRSSSKGIRKSKGGLKFTKNGQPYRIMANGRARFVKR